MKKLAARLAAQIVKEGAEAGLSPVEMCELCELIMSIVIYAQAEDPEFDDKLTWAQELLSIMTSRMRQHVTALINGEKF